MREERPGYKWVDCGGDNGFWEKITGEGHSHKTPFFCPYEFCKRPTGTVDDKYLHEYGICYLCFTLYVDAREKPAIDLEKYRPQKKIEE